MRRVEGKVGKLIRECEEREEGERKDAEETHSGEQNYE